MKYAKEGKVEHRKPKSKTRSKRREKKNTTMDALQNNLIDQQQITSERREDYRWGSMGDASYARLDRGNADMP
jgi:hypothetical protein